MPLTGDLTLLIVVLRAVGLRRSFEEDLGEDIGCCISVVKVGEEVEGVEQ